MRDVLLLAVALVGGLGLAFARTFRSVWLLVPADPRQPVPTPPGAIIPWRFVPYRLLADRSKDRPRILLGLLLFVLLALLLKLIAGDAGDWRLWLYGVGGITLAGGFAVGGYINTMAALVMLGVPAAAAWALGAGPTGIGLAAGCLLGSHAGILLGRNYRYLVHTTRLEHARGETLRGEPVGPWGRAYRRVYGALLRAVPVMMLYQLVAFFWRRVDLQHVGEGWGYGLLGRYVLPAVALGIGLNIVLYTYPLFRKMLEGGSIESAGAFNVAVREWEALHPSDKAAPGPLDGDLRYVLDEHPRDTVDAFLGPKGEWVSFQRNQIDTLYFVVLILLVGMVGQTLDKALLAGLIPAGVRPDLAAVARIALGVMWCANAMVLITLVAALPDEDQEGPGIDEQNIEVIWRAIRDSALRVVCRVPEDGGGEPHLEVLPPGATATSEATTRLMDAIPATAEPPAEPTTGEADGETP